jgi:hypothetical protein
LLSQKEGNQEKGDREAAALRVPKKGSQSRRGAQTRFAQTCAPLIPCLTTFFGSYLNTKQINGHFNFNFKKIQDCNIY